jgi:hypothetical protein
LDPEFEPYIISPLENHDYILVCNKPLIEEILSFSKFEDIHSLYTNLFDDNHLHEYPLVYHPIQYLQYYYNATLNDQPKQKYFLALIDQILILNEIPSNMHNVESSQFEFLEHAESQFDNDHPIFNQCFEGYVSCKILWTNGSM